MKVVVNEQLGIQEIEIIINCSSKDETVQALSAYKKKAGANK